MRFLTIFFLLVTNVAWAQRDAPLLECYLPSINVVHAEDGRLSVDLILKKEGGPGEHREHKMVLLLYLLDDEEEVLNLVSDPTLLDKTMGDDAKLFLDVLLERGLVTILDSKVAKRHAFAAQDIVGKYSDGSRPGERSREDFLKLNTFEFSFSPRYNVLFDKVSQLKNFNNEPPPENAFGIYQQRFKIMPFVPVNDCKYATDVMEGLERRFDFALDEYFNPKTPIHYCRPLPYEFQFCRRDFGFTIFIR